MTLLNRAAWMIVPVLIAFGVAGCWVPTQVSYRGVKAKMDPAMTVAEKAAVESDVLRFMSVDIAVPEKSLAGRVFSGTNFDSVLGFLDERIKYVLSSGSKFEERVYAGFFKEETKGVIGAMNRGAGMFFNSLGTYMNSGAVVLFKDFEGQLNPVLSPRIGVIQLGDLYRSDAFLAEKSLALDRMGILVHEARHSDCTGGLSQEDLKRVAVGKIPNNLSCSHLHVVCPPSHPMSGLAACEIQPWGAYFTQAVFNVAVASTCTDCTEEERQVAQMGAADGFSRIYPPTLEDMTSGAIGAPDMSHTEVVSVQ